jgi:metal-sulfur cluster biosynthetic enzyme
MTVAIREQEVHAALRGVVDPCSIATGAPIDIVDMGLVRRVEISAGAAVIGLRLTNPFCLQAANIADRIREVVAHETGLEATVEIDVRDEWWPEMMAPGARRRLRRIRPI